MVNYCFCYSNLSVIICFRGGLSPPSPPPVSAPGHWVVWRGGASIPGQKLAGQPPGPARWHDLASTAGLALVLLRMRASSLGQAPVMRACE